MSFSIKGKTAIVTGAANGVGLAIARHFVDQGAKVMFADLDEAQLDDQVGTDFEEDSPIRVFAGDLRQKLTQANLLSATIDAFDRVDVLVNAARQVAVTDPLNPDDTSVADLMEQNLFAAMKLSQLIARRMIKQGEDARHVGGAIINLSSIAAERTHTDLMGYSIAAAACNQMTRSMALALAHHGIRVNAVAFGSVMSASLKRSLKEQADLRDEINTHTPLARIAKASELAEMVQFLASESAGFITGQVMTVDGGRTLLDPVGQPVH
jgi:7-alpha-hydroxysteroid dehydrogenase